jgi:alkanesulfonate monooxygenase SsuD/methylene tetrahydromethanopterin reductase-like flavin-dependent oxidoreductase (luciferase family)
LHDTVWFEIHGKPAVAIASSEFVDAAETQARALGMTDARRLFVAHPIQDATDDEMRAKADAVVDAVIDALTRSA